MAADVEIYTQELLRIKDTLFKWDGLSEEDLSQKLLDLLKAAALGTAGFAIAGVPGAIIGTILGFSLDIPIDDAAFGDRFLEARNHSGDRRLSYLLPCNNL